MEKNTKVLPLMAYLFFAYSSLTVFVGYLPVYFQFNGWTQTQIGWLMAMGPLAAVFAQPFWGYMSDKWKTIKNILMLCMVMSALVSCIFLQVNTLWLLFLFGFIQFLFLAPCTALGDSLSQKIAIQQRLTFGSIRMWGSLGFAVSSLATGYVLEALSPAYIALPFLICALTAFVLTFFLQDATPSETPVTIVDAIKYSGNPRVLIFLVLVFFISVGHRANDSFLGLFVIELGGRESLIGKAWFIGVVSEAVIFALAFFWFRKFHPLFFIIVSGFLYSLRWFFMSYLNDPIHVLWVQVFHGVSFGFMYFASLQYITRLVPEQLQATGHLLFITTFFGLSGLVGTLGGGWVLDEFGGEGLYGSLAVLAFIGSISLLIYYAVNRRHLYKYSSS